MEGPLGAGDQANYNSLNKIKNNMKGKKKKLKLRLYYVTATFNDLQGNENAREGFFVARKKTEAESLGTEYWNLEKMVPIAATRVRLKEKGFLKAIVKKAD